MSIVGSSSTALPAFDPSVTVDATATLHSGGALDWHGRGYVVRRTDGVLVMFYRRATSHTANDAEICIKFSDDNGATWTAVNTNLSAGAVSGFPLQPPVGNIMIGEAMPILVASGDIVLHIWSYTGTWNVNAVANGIYQLRSSDGGETWTSPVAVDYVGTSADTLTFTTDDWFTFDGVTYLGARNYDDSAGSSGDIWLMKSTDDGETWEKVSEIMTTADETDGGQEVGLTYLGDGVILAMCRDNPHVASYQRISTDMGLTWGTLTDVTSTVGIAGRQRLYTVAQLMGLPGWWLDNRLIMEGFVHQSSGDSMPRRRCVWLGIYNRSAKTVTWSTPFYLAAQTDDGGYGDIWYAGSPGEFSVVNYAGSLTAASLTQDDITVEFFAA